MAQNSMSNRGVEVDLIGGTPGRQARDIHTPRLDREVAHDLAGDPSDQRGLTLITMLVACVEPVQHLETLADTSCAGYGRDRCREDFK